MFRFTAGSVACSFLMVLAACGDSTGEGGSGAGTNTGAGTSQGGDGGSGAAVTDGGSGAGISDGGMTTTSLNGGGPTDGGGGEGAGGPMECPSEVSNVPEGPCDLYLQDCPSMDDTCEILDADPETSAWEPITGCITRTGLKGLGQSCNTSDECSKKLTCVGNVCTPFCCEDDANSCQGGDCNVNVNLIDENGDPTIYHFQACSFSEACDLFTPDSCPANQNCYLGDPGEASCYTVYMPPENPDLGACDSLNECADSAVCVGDPGTCRYLCMINSAQPPGLGGCPQGQACDTNSFNTGFAGVGLCVGGT